MKTSFADALQSMTDYDALVERAKAEVTREPPRCADFDEDCDDLDHLHCYLYDPQRGYCPFLRSRTLSKDDER